jgi:hypothetical protein
MTLSSKPSPRARLRLPMILLEFDDPVANNPAFGGYYVILATAKPEVRSAAYADPGCGPSFATLRDSRCRIGGLGPTRAHVDAALQLPI